jgi:DNA-binding response OmpR family regulator
MDLHDTYILLITADHGEAGKVEGLLAGADDYLAKPVSKDELLARVQIGLRIRRIRQQSMESQRRAVAAELMQQSLADALRGAEKAVADAVMRVGAEDRDGAMRSLRTAHDAIRGGLAVIPAAAPSPPT